MPEAFAAAVQADTVDRPPTGHYLEFRASGGINGSPHPIGQFRGMAAVIAALHIENSKGAELGLPLLAAAFPDLLDRQRNAMARVRIFGDADGLARLKVRTSGILSLTQAEARFEIMASDVRETPHDHHLAAFMRDRSADREFEGHAERAMVRAQRKAVERASKGEEVKHPPQGMAERMAAIGKRRMHSFGVPRAYLKLNSASTSRQYALFILGLAGVNGSENGRIDTFGLSRRGSLFAVPHF
jgi:CRISPR-associated protein (Cas_Csy4)